MKKDLQNALSTNTQNQYNTNWRSFKTFTESRLYQQPLPATPLTISLYATHLHNNLHLKGTTIRTHLSAIAYQHQLAGYPSPTDNFIVNKLLLSYSKHDNPPAIRRAISKSILVKLIQSIKTHENKRTQALYCALFTLMFHGLLRCSEVTKSTGKSHNLLSTQVSLVGKGHKKVIRIAFKSYKHSKPAPPHLDVKRTGGLVCPIDALKSYLLQRESQAQACFCNKDNSEVKRAQIVKMLKKHLSYIGLPPSDYNTHSFRIGKATAMAKSGHTHSQIALAGRWNSNAFLKYIKPTLIRV